jgi:hypothetical protein
MAERRDFVRISKNIKVLFKVIVDKFANPGIPSNVSFTRSLSGNGMLLFLPKPLDNGVKLELTILIPDGNEEGIDTAGEVLGHNKLNENEYELKVRFTDIDEQSRDRLAKYVMREDVREKKSNKNK